MAAITTISETRTRAKVVFLRAYRVQIPLKSKIRHASHVRNSSENLVVECKLDDGTTGFGEGVPREYVTGETIDFSLDLLNRTDWSQIQNPNEQFGDAVEMIRSLTLPHVENDLRGCVGNAARCAAELALLDAFGKRFGVSLQRLAEFVPETESIRKLKDRCQYSGAVTSKSWHREFISAVKLKIVGFPHIKIKVGTAGQDDPARLKMFRRVFGWRKDFRIDANEAWTPANVVAQIQSLMPYGITAVEQPVTHENRLCLADVRNQVDVPIMHDESLCSMADAKEAVEKKTCDIFNIRLSKCGGLIRSMELAAFARRHGLKYQLGCQIGETGILSAAGRSFACSIDHIRYLEGSYDRHLVRERLTDQDITFNWTGYAPALTSPGLGVTVSRERLKAVTTAESQLFMD